MGYFFGFGSKKKSSWAAPDGDPWLAASPRWPRRFLSARNKITDSRRFTLLPVFDIEYNGFWLEEWGPTPKSLADAQRIASELVTAAPTLIPIFGHRMMPDEPHLVGNPVFSVHQTDIIYYGFDLADYFRHEFQLPGREPWPQSVRPIRFWDLDRFQNVRWAGGSCVFDNRKGQLP